MKPANRRRPLRRGILTTTTLGSICLSLLATSLGEKELTFRMRCMNTELANELHPAQPADEQVSEVQTELLAEAGESLAQR